jgi:amino acid transporter
LGSAPTSDSGAGASASASGARRQLTLLDCFGLGVNGIVGSGIFLLPAALYRRAGGASPWAWLISGGICTLVALCFAEAAGRTDRSGGPYRYACDAFGMRLGFAVGWITVVSSLLGYAAVARGFAEHAALLAGAGAGAGGGAGGDAGSGAGGVSVALAASAVALVGLLGALNVWGVKPSARAGDAISAIKLLGLCAFVAFGLAHVDGARLHAAPAPLADETPGLAAAAYAGMFACTGFEYVPVPAGETVNPRRAVAIALVTSLLGATGLYALVQVVAVGVTPGLGASATPLVDAAGAFAGRGGAAAMAAVALISAFGFCSGSALVVPRYLESFARDGFLPALLGRRAARFDTPVAAIVATSLVVAPLAALVDFKRLADISMIAVVVQYVSTCLAIPVERLRRGPPTGFRLPLGWTVPLAGAAGAALFLASVSAAELAFTGGLLVLGVVLALATRLGARRARV